MAEKTALTELSESELKMLHSALGNHTRAELREHLTTDFGEEVADELIPPQGTFISIITGEDKVHNLFGKLDELIKEAN